jgi:hypothetical protein
MLVSCCAAVSAGASVRSKAAHWEMLRTEYDGAGMGPDMLLLV